MAIQSERTSNLSILKIINETLLKTIINIKRTVLHYDLNYQKILQINTFYSSFCVF